MQAILIPAEESSGRDRTARRSRTSVEVRALTSAIVRAMSEPRSRCLAGGPADTTRLQPSSIQSPYPGREELTDMDLALELLAQQLLVGEACL
jgi:hypothetical protein